MGSNSQGYWGGKLMHRAGFDLTTQQMRRPHVLVEQVHHLNQCATLPLTSVSTSGFARLISRAPAELVGHGNDL